MDVLTLCKSIDLQADVTDGVRHFMDCFDLKQVSGMLDGMMVPSTSEASYEALRASLGNDPDHLKMLACQLYCASRVYDQYQEKGISDAIYFDTMKCFERFLDECRVKTGKTAFDRGWWTYRQLNMTLFRIGELEFEFLNDGTIALHIPSDADLTEEAVNRSLRRAKQFAGEQYPAYCNSHRTCRSWLLSPALLTLLDENTNIVRFQKRFAIQHFDESNKEFIGWLFHAPVNTLHKDLCEDTSLQRKAKALLLNGGCIGAAFGVLKE